MKIALVTTPPSLASGIGDYTRHLLPELSRHGHVDLFVEDGREGELLLGREMRPVGALVPREYDQIVYQLGNEIAHAFMAPLVRRLGGTVVLHDWVLFDMALAAHPALARGGLKGLALALREGGLGQANIYVDNFLARRRARSAAHDTTESSRSDRVLLDGWHAIEPDGRWTSELARVRLSGSGLERVRIAFATEAGRRVQVACAERSAEATASEKSREFELAMELRGLTDPILEISAGPLFESDEQRRHHDTRRLGAFVRRITVRDAHGERDLDLNAQAAATLATLGLTRDRFRLCFNRSIVRFADAFLVHSNFVREKILVERTARTQVAVVHHGASARWSDEDRRMTRARLNLPADWQAGILLTSFGNVQAHKRIEPLLQAFAAARRERSDLRLALIGTEDRETLNVPALLRQLGLESSVRLTGHVHESEAWPWIHAGDFAVQLRGPSTGGSSGGVFQSLGLGRGVIASDLDEQRELPGACVLRVAPGAGEVAALSKLILELASDAARRGVLEQAARTFVENECSWSKVATTYAENLSRFPRARASRNPLWRQTRS